MLNKTKLLEVRELLSTKLNNVKSLESNANITLQGEISNGYSLSTPSVVVDASKSECKRYVAVTGENSFLLTGNFSAGEEQQINDCETIARLALLGDHGLVSAPTSNTTTCSMGDESNILISLEDNSVKLTNSRAYVAGKLGGIHAFANFVDSVLMSTAEQGPIYVFGEKSEENVVFHAGNEGEISYYGTSSQILSLGVSSSIDAANDNTVYNSGDESELNLGDNSTVFNTGKNSTLRAGNNSVVYCTRLPVNVAMGVNSCLVMQYHDGTRNRVSVIYVGQDNIQAGKVYNINEQGQVSENNTAK